MAETICRTCLEIMKVNKSYSLYSTYNKLSLLNILEFCMPEMNYHNTVYLSYSICMRCVRNLITVFLFRKSCFLSDKYIHIYLEKQLGKAFIFNDVKQNEEILKAKKEFVIKEAVIVKPNGKEHFILLNSPVVRRIPELNDTGQLNNKTEGKTNLSNVNVLYPNQNVKNTENSLIVNNVQQNSSEVSGNLSDSSLLYKSLMHNDMQKTGSDNLKFRPILPSKNLQLTQISFEEFNRRFKNLKKAKSAIPKKKIKLKNKIKEKNTYCNNGSSTISEAIESTILKYAYKDLPSNSSDSTTTKVQINKYVGNNVFTSSQSELNNIFAQCSKITDNEELVSSKNQKETEINNTNFRFDVPDSETSKTAENSVYIQMLINDIPEIEQPDVPDFVQLLKVNPMSTLTTKEMVKKFPAKMYNFTAGDVLTSDDYFIYDHDYTFHYQPVRFLPSRKKKDTVNCNSQYCLLCSKVIASSEMQAHLQNHGKI